MSLFEIIAAALGIISVYLSTRQNVLAWPTSLINNIMYFVFFLRQHLFALMALQAFFGLIAIYGWYKWLFGGAQKTPLRVTRVPPALGLGLILLSATGTVAIWYVLKTWTTDTDPGIDAFFFAVSLVAQWMMTRKILENWVLWIVADIVYVPMYVYKGLPVTAVLYAIFLALAVLGLRSWRRSYQTNRLAEPAAA